MCISLGRQAAVFQFAHRDDTAARLYVGGRLAAKFKESACTSPVKQLAVEARKPGSHSWPVKDAKRQQRLQRLQDRPGAAQDGPGQAARARQAS